MSETGSNVWFEDAGDGGVELVFSDELVEKLGVDEGDCVDVSFVVVDGTDVQMEIEFDSSLDEAVVEEIRDEIDGGVEGPEADVE
jgi:hypothetical protein